MNNYARNHLQYDNLNNEIMLKNSSFGDYLKNVPNIDDELNEEDDESEEEYCEKLTKQVCSIDGYGDDIAESEIKDQDIIEAEQLEKERIQRKSEIMSTKISNESSSDENDEKQDVIKSKSQFFLSSNKQETPDPNMNNSNEHQDYFFTRLYDNERIIDSLSNIACFYSSNILDSESLKDVSSDSIKIKGKLMLTTFQLIFIPYVNQINSKLANLDDSILSLFVNKVHPFSFVIPLSLIYEIKSINQSDKYRRVETLIENNTLIRDILIKCKNFMTKRLVFPSPNKNLERISTFVKNLINSSNVQRVRTERFRQLIVSVVTNFNSNQIKNDTTRKSYLTPNDLYQDLAECECDEFMQIKNGSVQSSQFEIRTMLPFFAAPKNVASIIQSRRVVINETNVNEFNQTNDTHTNPTNLTVARKSSRVTELFSPRTKQNSSSSLAINQYPVIADLSYTNPFFEKNFPLWAFTDNSTGCSLIILPDCIQSHKHEECEIIIKNYNALLCDEIIKSKKSAPNNVIKINSFQYGEYEYYKFKVPFDHRKISESYLKLMEMCSFKTSEDYHKEYESNSFYQRLHNTKWLKKISNLLQLTSKIVDCIHLLQRNVFLEEQRGNSDCSCILTSLIKICTKQKYRTIVGFENLIQKDWFLAGHPFSKRFESNFNNSDEYLIASDTDRIKGSYSTAALDSKDQNNTSNKSFIAPTFLLFLDCVFQLTLQYPKEFEFNEIYLIHMWDYSLSNVSFSFSFDGVLAWLNFQESEKFFLSTDTQIDTESKENFYKKIFNANNSFWLSHLEANAHLVKNVKYEPDGIILSPNEKLFQLKFWSRNYLRWHEKYHAYNTHEMTSNQTTNKQEPVISPKIKPQRPAPPPPLQSPAQAIPTSRSNNNLNNNTINISNVITTTILAPNTPKITYSSSGLKITTRITDDGDMQSSF